MDSNTFDSGGNLSKKRFEAMDKLSHYTVQKNANVYELPEEPAASKRVGTGVLRSLENALNLDKHDWTMRK